MRACGQLGVPYRSSAASPAGASHGHMQRYGQARGFSWIAHQHATASQQAAGRRRRFHPRHLKRAAVPGLGCSGLQVGCKGLQGAAGGGGGRGGCNRRVVMPRRVRTSIGAWGQPGGLVRGINLVDPTGLGVGSKNKTPTLTLTSQARRQP